MSTLIVYYSLNGNTDYAARLLQEKLGADTLRLEPVKAFPDKGFKKFIYGGKSALMAETPELVPYTFDAEKYDCVIIGFPVWAANVAPPIRTFVKENDLRGKKVAAFACQGGSGAEKAFVKLAAAIGIEEIAPALVLNDPKDRPKPEHAEKIEAFCKMLS